MSPPCDGTGARTSGPSLAILTKTPGDQAPGMGPMLGQLHFPGLDWTRWAARYGGEVWHWRTASRSEMCPVDFAVVFPE
jgi:hypothetical protein